MLRSLVVGAVLGVLALAGAAPAAAQDMAGETPSDTVAWARPGRALDLGVRRVGVSLGNSPRWTGLRVNWSDAGVEGVNGVNLTLWRPKENPAAVYNGLSLGLVAPVGKTIRGATLGGIAVVADGDVLGAQLAGIALVSGGSAYGINAAGLGVVSSGSMYGLNAAGLGLSGGLDLVGVNFATLGVVAQHDIRGITVAGLGAVAQHDIMGITATTLGVTAQHDIRGITIAGLGIVAQRDIVGLNATGLGLVAEGSVRWVNLAGLGVVGQSKISGLSVAGLGVVSGGGSIEGVALSPGVVESADGVRGIILGGYRVKGQRVAGLSLNPVMLKAREFSGVAVGAHNEVMGRQRGLTIGLYNYARQLQGVQIGVLNYAGNNPRWLRLLPLINVHF